MKPEPIPDDVLDGLAFAREDGGSNMYDRLGVLRILNAHDKYAAFLWLHDNKDRYLDALTAMGGRRRAVHR